MPSTSPIRRTPPGPSGIGGWRSPRWHRGRPCLAICGESRAVGERLHAGGRVAVVAPSAVREGGAVRLLAPGPRCASQPRVPREDRGAPGSAARAPHLAGCIEVEASHRPAARGSRGRRLRDTRSPRRAAEPLRSTDRRRARRRPRRPSCAGSAPPTPTRSTALAASSVRTLFALHDPRGTDHRALDEEHLGEHVSSRPSIRGRFCSAPPEAIIRAPGATAIAFSCAAKARQGPLEAPASARQRERCRVASKSSPRRIRPASTRGTRARSAPSSSRRVGSSITPGQSPDGASDMTSRTSIHSYSDSPPGPGSEET